MSGSPLSAERGRIALAALRPKVSSRLDLLRAKGKLNPNGSKVDEPSRFPCESGAIFVGRGGHALDLGLLRRLCIGAVLNCAPNVCTDPESKYEKAGISYMSIDARDDAAFRILDSCLETSSQFIAAAHSRGVGVLVHCMAGVNRSATLAIAYILASENRSLLPLAEECIAARPSILQNKAFQLQLCELALKLKLLDLCVEPDSA